jgi:hypothetical protein
VLPPVRSSAGSTAVPRTAAAASVRPAARLLQFSCCTGGAAALILQAPGKAPTLCCTCSVRPHAGAHAYPELLLLNPGLLLLYPELLLSHPDVLLLYPELLLSNPELLLLTMCSLQLSLVVISRPYTRLSKTHNLYCSSQLR